MKYIYQSFKWAIVSSAMVVTCTNFIQAQSISGKDLADACEQALLTGFYGNGGMMCHWYVTPCDCSYGKEDLPRVCLPPSIKEEDLAQKVIAGLQSDPYLLKKDAAMAANTILSALYPCRD